jgi:hypothetical protein
MASSPVTVDVVISGLGCGAVRTSSELSLLLGSGMIPSTFRTVSLPQVSTHCRSAHSASMLNRGNANEGAGNRQLSLIATAQSGQALDTSSWESPGTLFSVGNRLNCVSGVDPVFPESKRACMVQSRGSYQHGSDAVRKLRTQQPDWSMAGEFRRFDDQGFPDFGERVAPIPHGNV